MVFPWFSHGFPIKTSIFRVASVTARHRLKGEPGFEAIDPLRHLIFHHMFRQYLHKILRYMVLYGLYGSTGIIMEQCDDILYEKQWLID